MSKDDSDDLLEKFLGRIKAGMAGGRATEQKIGDATLRQVEFGEDEAPPDCEARLHFDIDITEIQRKHIPIFAEALATMLNQLKVDGKVPQSTIYEVQGRGDAIVRKEMGPTKAENQRFSMTKTEKK